MSTENSLLSNPIFSNRTFFPTNSDKTPKVPHWKADALPAEKAVLSWAEEQHWAMPTGNGLLVVDVDTKNGGNEEDVYTIGFPKGTFRVQTPSGGCHLYYRDVGLNLKNSVQKLGKGIDIRAEGGYVCIPPMPGYKITCDHEPKIVMPYELKLPNPEPTARLDIPTEHFDEGTRNQSLFTIGSSLRARGIPPSGIEGALQAMNKDMCNPPLPEHEVQRIVQSIMSFESGELRKSEGSHLTVLNAEDIDKRDGDAKQSFIWKEHVLDKMPTLLYAEGGMGKTTLSLLVVQELLATDKNATILWLPVENNMESTRIQMKDFQLDKRRFLILERSTGGYSVDFKKEEDLQELGRLMAIHRPRLVVIDSLGSMSSADINSNGIREVMKNVQDIVCEQNKAALIYIHHENKSELATARNKSMGSNMILAQVRMALRLTEGGKENARILTSEKWNLNRPDPLQIVSLEGGAFEVSPVDLAGGGDSVAGRVESALRDLFSHDLKLSAQEVYSALEHEHNIMIPEDIEWTAFWPICNKLNVRYNKEDDPKSFSVRRLLKV